MVKALDRVSQITGAGFGRLDLESAVPARRLTELARYGMTASATQIRRHPSSRQARDAAVDGGPPGVQGDR
jgi:hypothetical protein